jgi:hypothetical protein
MILRISAVALLVTATLSASDDVRCRSRVVFPPDRMTVTVPFERTRNGIFVQARVNAHPEALWFALDSGSAHTLINDTLSRHLEIAGAAASKSAASLDIGGVTIDRIDLRATNLAPLAKQWGRRVDGVIGYDLLCRATIDIDYEASHLTLTQPAVFRYAGMGESLKLYIRNGFSFVEGTIKVTGLPAVIDVFQVDSGSQEAVNHPIIRDSKGPLHKISSADVLGPNEWFQLGKYTIGSTNSIARATQDENSRQIGAEVLSRFRVCFDYPHKRLIVERATR